VVAAQPRDGAAGRAKRAIIDADVHNVVENEKLLFPYLARRWRRHLELFGVRGPTGGRRTVPTNRRADARPPTGGRPGSDPAFLREQLLDGWGIDLGILIPLTGVGRSNNLELDAALARAVNDWQVAEWLDPEPRLRASIVVPYEDARLAVEEIERRAPDRRFVQVQFMGRARAPMGDRTYWPIYEAAEREGLPICSHASGGSGYPITGAGWPSFDLEEHVGPAQAMPANIASLVFNGVFERFPRLKIVSTENGFGWAPPLMWRLDGCWKVLKDEVPELKRPPSEYVREHVYFSAQPMEQPDKPEHFLQLIEHFGYDDRIFFASGYPDHDFDSPEGALPVRLPEELAHKIFYANAHALHADRL
jgi:hypothetical protein